MADVECYKRDGVAIRRYGHTENWRRPPIVMVHGGAHAGWCWDRWADYLAEAGNTCYVFDWYGHGDSDGLPADMMADRSIVKVAKQELALLGRLTADWRNRGPVLIGHSMGALAALSYAGDQWSRVSGLALVAPVVPMQAKADAIPIDVTFGELFGPPPFEAARQMFFPAMSDGQARELHSRLQRESSRAVWEATRFTVWVTLSRLPNCPKLVISGELDTLTPPSTAATLARLIGTDAPVSIAGQGHSDLLLNDHGWQLGAQAVGQWLEENF